MKLNLRRLSIILGLVAGAAAGCGSAPPESVVLIVVDTLRPDHLGLYGYERDTTPHLDAWSREALVFEQAWSTSSWTLPAFGSLLTGMYPAQHGAGQLLSTAGMPIPGALGMTVPTLSDQLISHQWATMAVVNNPFLHQQFGINRGFQHYDYQHADNRKLRRADQSVDDFLEGLEQLQSPFFAMLHLFDPHMDYDPPPSFRGRFSGSPDGEYPVNDFQTIRRQAPQLSPERRHFIQAAYDEEIAFVDEQLGRLFSALEQNPRLTNLFVVVTSDHGEEFFEHGSFEHGHSLHGEVVRVPLLMRGPGVTPGRSKVPVTLADVPATVLDAFGLEPLNDAAGVSLWQLLTQGERLPPRDLPAEGILWGARAGALLEWPYRLLLDENDSSARLYDLRSDPGEQSDLSKEDPQTVSRMLQSWQRLSRQQSPVWTQPDIDAETLERLRSLGYIR